MPHFKLRIGGKTMVMPDGILGIGRMSDCWLTLDDELASRYHAQLKVQGPLAEIEDLGSRNGTYVNGQKLTGAQRLQSGDEIRIGRESIAVLGPDSSGHDEDEDLRRTLAPGEDTKFPSLIGQLVHKSLKVGKTKEAERYATALVNQIGTAKVGVEHPAAQACVDALLSLAEHTNSGIWIDRGFALFAAQGWPMPDETLDRIRGALDRIPRVPGRGMREYEKKLRSLEKEGVGIPPGLTDTIAELADAYSGG